MSTTIKPKLDTQLKRQISQGLSERKTEQTSQQLESLKNLGQAIKQSHADQRAVANATHAVNHIQSKDDVTSNSDSTRLYTRQGKLENLNASDIADPEVEDAEDRFVRHKNEKSDTQEAQQVARDQDEFYQVKDRGNTIKEDSQGYYIDAYAPEHEKAGVRVSITHDKAVISGSRKAEAEESNARGKMVTNNFQTFREEFKFDTPVVANGMTRERSGDYIRFFIPKLGVSDGSDES